jgi:hypothetical protein
VVSSSNTCCRHSSTPSTGTVWDRYAAFAAAKAFEWMKSRSPADRSRA